VFYFGESVLLKAYRGRGLGVRLFEEREAHARSLGARYTVFCAVQRPADHPRRPPGYVALDAFWNRRGYRRHPSLHTAFRWRDVDEPAETSKTMAFWFKELG
jgi:GNAT superfamily N-acetyltransferase